jgi:hypothetical protein
MWNKILKTPVVKEKFMFIKLFSDHVYSKDMWENIFYLENITQSILREFFENMINLPKEKLQWNLKEYILEYESMNSRHKSLDFKVIDNFLEHEIMYIFAFLNGADRMDMYKNEDAFLLRSEIFMNCIKESQKFKNFITNYFD